MEYMELLTIRELEDGVIHHWTKCRTKSSHSIRDYANAMGLFEIIRKEEWVSRFDVVMEQGYVMRVVTEAVANLL